MIRAFTLEWLKLKNYRIFWILFAIYLLAQYLQRRDDHGIRPAGIISTSMSLLQNERELIETVFDCPVTDRSFSQISGIAGATEQGEHGAVLVIDVAAFVGDVVRRRAA